MLPGNYSIKGLLLWKSLEIAFLFLFIYSLYNLEIGVIDSISGNDKNFEYISVVYDYLHGLKSNFLPLKMWFMTWSCFIVSISLIVFKKWRWHFIALTGILTATLLIADKIFYASFSSIITSSSFKMANQLWDIKYSIFNLLTISEVIEILFFSVFCIVGIVVNKYTDSSLGQNSKAFITDKALGIIFFLVALNCFNTAFYLEKSKVEWVIGEDNQHQIIAHASQAELKKNYRKEKQHFKPPFQTSSLDFAVSFGILNFHIHNLHETIERAASKNEITEQKLNKVTKWLEHKRCLNQIRSHFWRIANGRNVFLIALESFHPLLLNLEIDNVPVTPTLNRLKPQAMFWRYFLEQSYGGGSSDAEFAVMTGLLPSRRYLSAIDLPGIISLTGMPFILKKHGYQTFSFHGYKASFWNRNISHPSYGFDKMYFMESFSAEQMLGMGIPDKQFFCQTLDILKDKPYPFFAYMVSLSTHHPYQDIPEKYKGLFTESADAGSEIAGYLQLVRYTDDALGKFVEKAKREGYWENSMFVLYGDHAPPLSKGAKKRFEEITGGSLTNYKQQRSPLLVLIPGKQKKIQEYRQKYSSVTGDQHDIFPTILHLLGLEIPYGISGTHLFVSNDKRDPVFITNKIFVYNGIMYHGPSGNFEILLEKKGKASLTPDEIQNKHLKSLRDMKNHEIIYEYDAQAKAADNFDSSGSECNNDY